MREVTPLRSVTPIENPLPHDRRLLGLGFCLRGEVSDFGLIVNDTGMQMATTRTRTKKAHEIQAQAKHQVGDNSSSNLRKQTKHGYGCSRHDLFRADQHSTHDPSRTADDDQHA